MKICSLSILFLSIPAVGSIFAQEQPVEKMAQGELPSLLAIYKDIHSHPELSCHEEKTSALVAKELRAANRAGAHRHGRVAGRRRHRPALRQQSHDQR